MPQVPFSGVPSVAPQQASTPRYSADVNASMFGGAVADATRNLGKSIEGAGDELFKRGLAMQDLYNHSEAQQADADYMEKAGKLHADFSSLAGKQAVDAYPGFIQSLKDARKETGEGLSNDMSRKLFDSQSLSTMGRSIFNGAGHAATENKKYALGASAARVSSISNQTLSQPNDENAFQDGMQDAEDEVRAQGQLAGQSPEAIEEAVSNTKSALWGQRITGLAKQQPLAAGKMLDDGVKSGEIRGEDIGKLTNLVQSARNTTGARMISSTVSSGQGMRWGAGTVDIKQAADAIGQIESGGNYSTIGVQTSHGRALGKYQVMEEFLPDYLKRAGLPVVDAKTFLADRSMQDQVFSANFSAYMKQTGSANDAASMWLTGKPLAEAGNVKDALGTNAQTYVANFNKALAKNAPLSAKVDMGTRLAAEQAPDDPLFPDMVRDRISADHNRVVQIKRDDQYTARQTIETGLMGKDDGKLPTTVEELRASDPSVDAAWDRLEPAAQRRYMGVLARNAKGDHAWTDEGLRQYQQIKGQAQVDPAGFLDFDVVGTDLPNSAKRELINLQGRLKGKAEGDPRVQRALNILKPDMQAAGIDPKDKDTYYQFTGALSDQLATFADENKRPPKIDEVKLIGSRLMQSQKTPGFLWGTNDTPTYSVPVPRDEAEKIKADPAWTKLAITPTDAQIQRIYTRKLYNDLYGGKPKTLIPVSQ